MTNPTCITQPITVIALFAALSEASAATVLPHLDAGSRELYIWFLIGFPSALVTLFFLTLNFNPRVLYAPRSGGAAAKAPEKNRNGTG